MGNVCICRGEVIDAERLTRNCRPANVAPHLKSVRVVFEPPVTIAFLFTISIRTLGYHCVFKLRGTSVTGGFSLVDLLLGKKVLKIRVLGGGLKEDLCCGLCDAGLIPWTTRYFRPARRIRAPNVRQEHSHH